MESHNNRDKIGANGNDAKAHKPTLSKEEILKIAPNYKGKPQNFDLEKFKSGRKSVNPGSTPKSKGERGAAKTTRKPQRSPILSWPKPSLMSGAPEQREATQPDAEVDVNEGQQTATSWNDIIQQEERSQEHIDAGTINEDKVRMIFYISRPTPTPGMTWADYEDEMLLWAVKMSLLIRQARSKCKSECKCCTTIERLVPTSFASEFRRVNGQSYTQERFRIRFIQQLNRQMVECDAELATLCDLLKRELATVRQLTAHVNCGQAAETTSRAESTQMETQHCDKATTTLVATMMGAEQGYLPVFRTSTHSMSTDLVSLRWTKARRGKWEKWCNVFMRDMVRATIEKITDYLTHEMCHECYLALLEEVRVMRLKHKEVNHTNHSARRSEKEERHADEERGTS